MQKFSCDLTLVAACGLRGELGLNGALPWHQPADMKFFAKTTQKSVVIMGRNTFDSLKKKLHGRMHCVLSTTMHSEDPDVIVVPSITAMTHWLADQQIEKAYIIGGQKIYDQCFSLCNTAIITHIHGIFKADTYLDLNKLADFEPQTKTFLAKDEANQYDMTFAIYKKLKIN
jgi:dihydrofolate reductase